MNATLFLLINLALMISLGIALRFWLRHQPKPQAARRLIFNIVMWLGCLICIAALALSLVSKNTQPVWLLTSTGLLIVSSMILLRRRTQPK